MLKAHVYHMYELHAYNNKASVVFYVAESDEENLPNLWYTLGLVHNSPVLVHLTKHVSKQIMYCMATRPNIWPV